MKIQPIYTLNSLLCLIPWKVGQYSVYIYCRLNSWKYDIFCLTFLFFKCIRPWKFKNTICISNCSFLRPQRGDGGEEGGRDGGLCGAALHSSDPGSEYNQVGEEGGRDGGAVLLSSDPGSEYYQVGEEGSRDGGLCGDALLSSDPGSEYNWVGEEGGRDGELLCSEYNQEGEEGSRDGGAAPLRI